MTTVRERFALEAERIVRSLSIDGAHGTSTAAIPGGLPTPSAQDDLLSEWDRAFLAGKIKYAGRDAERAVRIADVFCGAGGLSYGVREAIRACGLRPQSMLAVDTDPVKIEVYRRNFDPKHFSAQDLWHSVTKTYSTRGQLKFLARPQLLTGELQVVAGNVDVLLGGPPCEGHSTSNNITRRDDPRNKYYIVMPALAVALEARAVVIENVPGIRYDRGNYLETAKALFESEGYAIDEAIVDSVELGLPQTRKRHILIACRTGKTDIRSVVKRLRRPPRDLRWAIGDLMEVDMEVDSGDPMDVPADLSAINRRRIKYLFDNGLYDLPNQQRPDSHKGGHTYPSIYGRLQWHKPSGTITTGFNTPGRGRYIHPERQRTLTPHEAARIQGFPDCFEFKTVAGDTLTRSSLADMIGDAVPPSVGYAVGVAALAALDLTALPLASQ